MLVDSLYIGLHSKYKRSGRRAEYGLLKSWQWHNDHRILDLKLRTDRLWSDGKTVKAQDLIASWKDLAGEITQSPTRKLLNKIVGIDACQTTKEQHCLAGLKAINQHHLRIYFNQPASEFSEFFDSSMLYPIPSHFIERYGDMWWKRPDIPFNGPYQIEIDHLSIQYKIEQGTFRLVPNKLFHDQQATHIKLVEIERFDQFRLLRSKVESGKFWHLSYGSSLLVSEEKRFLFRKGWRIVEIADSSGIFAILLNPATLKPDLSAAIRYILSPDIVADRLLSEQTTTRLYYGVNRIKPFKNNFYIKNYQTRERLINQALSAMDINYKNPITVNLIYDLSGLKKFTVLIAALLKKRGIIVKSHYFDSFSSDEFKAFQQSQPIHIELLSWVTENDYPDWMIDMVDVSVLPLLTLPQRTQINKWQHQADKATDLKKRMEGYLKIEQLLVNDGGFLPFHRPAVRLIMSNQVCLKSKESYTIAIQDLYWCDAKKIHSYSHKKPPE